MLAIVTSWVIGVDSARKSDEPDLPLLDVASRCVSSIDLLYAVDESALIV